MNYYIEFVPEDGDGDETSKKIIIRWILASTLGWFILFKGILLFTDPFIMIIMLVVGSSLIGILQWLVIHNIESRVSGWIIWSTTGIVIGVIGLILLILVVTSFAIAGTFLGLLFLSIVAIVILVLPAIGLALAFFTETINFILKSTISRVNPEIAMIIEDIAIIAATTMAGLLIEWGASVILNGPLDGPLIISGLAFGAMSSSVLDNYPFETISELED